ncbi:hypothetical protein LXL04_026056 [Taraxacum kok-saghyz]
MRPLKKSGSSERCPPASTMSIPTALDLGLERIESAKVEFQVVWLKQSPSFYLHLIERISNMKLSKGPWRADGAIADPKNLSRGHHLCFSVSNVDEFVKTLEERNEKHKDKVEHDGHALLKTNS